MSLDLSRRHHSLLRRVCETNAFSARKQRTCSTHTGKRSVACGGALPLSPRCASAARRVSATSALSGSSCSTRAGLRARPSSATLRGRHFGTQRCCVAIKCYMHLLFAVHVCKYTLWNYIVSSLSLSLSLSFSLSLSLSLFPSLISLMVPVDVQHVVYLPLLPFF